MSAPEEDGGEEKGECECGVGRVRRGEREEGSDRLTSSRSKVGLVRSSQAMFARFFSPEGKDRDGISLIHTYLQVTTNLPTTHEQGHFQSLHVCTRENDKEQWTSKCDLLDELGHSQVFSQSSKFSVWMVSLT